MISFSRALFSAFTLTGLFFVLSPTSLAKSPEDFGRRYALFVTEQNQNTFVPFLMGQQVLESYFMGVPLKSSFQEGDGLMNQREFLTQFERLRLSNEGLQPTLSEDDLYQEAWLKARRSNWLPESKMTYQTMQEFLYRYEVSQAHGGIPYYDGLVLDMTEINPTRFSTLAQVKKIQQQLNLHIATLRIKVKPTAEEKALQSQLENYSLAFMKVEQELKKRESPLYKIPNLPQDIQQKIIDNDLNQVLNQLTYSYAHDTANRRYNVTKGASQISGRLYQPGENISFTQVLKEGAGGLSGYKYGWTIQGATEKWEYGGGLCGSATLFFTPSWRSGLEIVTRKGHSSYFSNLYPKESLGLDATIYFGSTDVVMKNNTDSPILYYVQDDKEKKEVTLYLIGNSPYASVTLEGPFRMGNTYTWIRHMTKPDGSVMDEKLITRYNRIY